MYIKLTDGTPARYTLRDLRKANSNTSFPAEPTADLLAEWGVFPYVATDRPAHDSATQVVEHQGYTETGGTYGDIYAVRDKTSDEVAAELAKTRGRTSLGKGEFCMGLIGLGIIAPSEAVSASIGNWPTSMDAFLSYLPADQAISVQIDWATETTINRNNVFVLTLGSWLDDVTPEILDTLFGIG